MSTDTPEVQAQEAEAATDEATVNTTTEKAEEKTPALDDARAYIYAKSDALRHPQPEAETQEEATAEATVGEEGEKTGEEDKSEAIEPEVVEEADSKDEKLTPREKRKLENLEAKEKRLSDWEKKLVVQFQAAGEPPKPKAPIDPAQVPLRHLTDDQFDEKYNELFTESPAKARRFEKAVEDARAAAARESEDQRIEADFRDFRSAYKDVTEDDWVQMNSPEFYEKYPAVTTAMQRGNHYAAFVAAWGALEKEKLVAARESAAQKEAAREAELRKRDEKKKKGTVLRVQTRVVQPIQKDEGTPSPEEIRRRRIAQMVEESQARQGLGPLRK
jgi:hypothetical protein